jgi:3-deoxy-7-phosphoheptulonate synthase
LDVIDEVARQIKTGNASIIGVMLESNLEEGNQPIPDDLKEILPGVSITDACINWHTTEAVLREFSKSIGSALKNRNT